MNGTTLDADINGAQLPRAVLVVDDHPLFCEALAMTLERFLARSEIRTANSLASGLDTLKGGFAADTVVLDLNLPDVSGVDGLVRIKTQMPDARIVIVSALSDNRVIAAVLEAGAAGFIRKDAPREVLSTAFEQIWNGKRFVPDSYKPPSDEALNDTPKSDVITRMSTLTPQQLTILRLVCDGKPNKLIAYELSIAETTVKAHITAILRKMGVHSRTQAALLAKEIDFSALQK